MMELLERLFVFKMQIQDLIGYSKCVIGPLSKEQMKERIVNYLEYMDEKDLREISTSLYNVAMRLEEHKRKHNE